MKIGPFSVTGDIRNGIHIGLEFRASKSPENPSVPLTGEVLNGLFGGATSMAGMTVTPETAMRLSAFQSGVRFIAETIASLPLDVFVRATGGGKNIAWQHAAYRLLHDEPNPDQTHFSQWETLVCQVILWGRAYIQTIWDNSGQLKALWLVHPSFVRKTLKDGEVWFQVTTAKGAYEVPSGSIVEVLGMSLDGWTGRSVIDLGVNALGQAMALDTFTSKYFANGAFPSGFLSTEKSLTEEARNRILAGWKAAYSGVAMAHKTAVFEEGMKWNPLSVDPEKAQLLLTKQFIWTEIFSLLRVPAFLMGFQDKTSTWGAGIEQMMIGVAQFTLRPWLVRIEQAINKGLFLPSEKGLYFVVHNIDGLLRGDYKSRQEGLAIQRQWGIISADEWRALENRNPQAGGFGKVYLWPVNMAPASLSGKADPGTTRALLVQVCDLIARRESSETRKLLSRNLPGPDLVEAQASASAMALADETLVQAVRALVQGESVAHGVVAEFRNRWAESSRNEFSPAATMSESGAFVRSITETWNQTRGRRAAEDLMQLIEEAHHEA